MNSEKPAFGISRVLLRIAWYGTFVCQGVMVILWISSFLSRDSSFFFKMNLITGILIFVINFFILREGWELVDGTNGMNILYLITGVLMILNVFCIPVAVIYIVIPLFMRIKEGIQLRG